MAAETIDLDNLRLKSGSHRRREDGVCLLEAAAWIAGEAHGDHPKCVCKILAAYGRNLNDLLPDDMRQELVPLLPKMIGTAGDGNAQSRGLMAADWMVRVYTPAFLRLRPELAPHADALASLPRIESWDALAAAQPALEAARNASAAAGADAGAAARAVAWAAARAAASAAARAVAWAAAGAAARDAAWDALSLTVATLQRSAIGLLREMAELPRKEATDGN